MSDPEGLVILIRHGSKADLDLKDPETGLPWRYDVVERARWIPAINGVEGVSLEAYGVTGEYKFAGAEEPFHITLGMAWPFDYYSLPMEPGAQVTDNPHTPNEGE